MTGRGKDNIRTARALLPGSGFEKIKRGQLARLGFSPVSTERT